MGSRGLLLACAIFMASGCLSVGPERSALQEKIGGSNLDVAQLRIQVRSLAPRFSGELELLSDELSTLTTDPAQRLSLLSFKINSISQMQMALFQPDPMAALIDSWALVAQLQQWVLKLPGIQGHPTAARLTDEQFAAMDRDLAGIWSNLTGRKDASPARRVVHEWAAENPLENLASRKSTTKLLSELTSRSGLSAGAAAGQLLESVQDISQRLDLQSAYLPKQARWQAEYLLLSALSDPALLGTGADTAGLLASLQGALQAADALPQWADGQRELTFAELDRQRLATQDFVTQERQAMLDALAQERAVVLGQTNDMGNAWIDHATDRAVAVADRILLRALILVILAFACGVLVAILLRRREERRGRRRVPLEA